MFLSVECNSDSARVQHSDTRVVGEGLRQRVGGRKRRACVCVRARGNANDLSRAANPLSRDNARTHTSSSEQGMATLDVRACVFAAAGCVCACTLVGAAVCVCAPGGCCCCACVLARVRELEGTWGAMCIHVGGRCSCVCAPHRAVTTEMDDAASAHREQHRSRLERQLCGFHQTACFCASRKRHLFQRQQSVSLTESPSPAGNRVTLLKTVHQKIEREERARKGVHADA